IGKANYTAKEHRWSTTVGEGGEMPVVLKRWSVPTGEPDNTERVLSGSVGGWGKRSVSYLARSLPNLVPRSRFRQRLRRSVRCHGRGEKPFGRCLVSRGSGQRKQASPSAGAFSASGGMTPSTLTIISPPTSRQTRPSAL